MALENIDFAIKINYFLLTTLLIIVVGYSYYIYRHTIPATSIFIKSVLISLRSLALILIIIILFEPIINFNYLRTNEPINLLFIDNSSSITNKDSLSRDNKVHNFITDYRNNISDNITIATFGKNVTPINTTEEIVLSFDEATTNFENLIPFIKKQKRDIATVTLISDGIITDGSNSTAEIERLNIPFFTIAIGDSTKLSDVGIKKVEFNKLIFLNTETEIKGVISNLNYENKKVIVSLIDKSGIVEQKQIVLNESGINNINFNYKPKKVGKQILTLRVSQLDGEDSHTNNKYPFVIDVLNDKTNVLVIAGAPSSDLSIVIQSLQSNKNIKLNKIIQIAENKFLDDDNYTNKLDSADVILMINFPSLKTPPSFLKSVSNNLHLKNTPYFLFLSELTDYHKLNNFNKILPFTIRTISNKYSQILPEIVSTGNGIVSNSHEWNNLAPINISDSKIVEKKGTSLLATANGRGAKEKLPLLFSHKTGSTRKIIFNGFNFWKWKLQSNNNLENLFDLFLKNSLKWLSTKKEKRIFVTTTKDIFNSNESISFLGNVYDETLTAVNDASLEVEIFSDNFRKFLKLQPSKNGIYNGQIDISKSGIFHFNAIININGEAPQMEKGKFLISDMEVENISFVLNSNYLSFISNITSGKSFNMEDYSDLFSIIKQLSLVHTNQEVISTKFEMWCSNWILIIIIILFAMEWIIRKQKGML